MTTRHRVVSTSLCIAFTTACLLWATLPAHGQSRNKTLVVAGHTGEVNVVQWNGRLYVDLQMLAETVNGALGYQGSRIVLTLPGSAASGSGNTADSNTPEAGNNNAFSKQFVRAAIETLGSMREWASALALTIKSGYPVGNAMAEYRARAATNFALSKSAASTDSDHNGLQLLTSEFENLQAWSNNLVQARNSMSAANFTLSQDALRNDPLSQKLLRCFQFLGPMLASGHFEDDGSCR